MYLWIHVSSVFIRILTLQFKVTVSIKRDRACLIETFKVHFSYLSLWVNEEKIISIKLVFINIYINYEGHFINYTGEIAENIIE